jgi:hypothetical protein
MAILPPSVSLSYVMLVGCGSNLKRKKGYSIVWLAFVWVMWRMRNDRIFNNKVITVEEVVDNTHRTSWQWYLSKVAKGSCLLYEWIWNPGDCMLLWWMVCWVCVGGWCFAASLPFDLLPGFFLFRSSLVVVVAGLVFCFLRFCYFCWLAASLVCCFSGFAACCLCW